MWECSCRRSTMKILVRRYSVMVVAALATCLTGAIFLKPLVSEAAVFQDKKCVKTRVCQGTTTGGCTPQGFFCLDNGCDNAVNTCSWAYIWSCDNADCNTCTTGSQNEIGTDCEPECKLIFYNQCACPCQSLGQGVEGGFYPQCW